MPAIFGIQQRAVNTSALWWKSLMYRCAASYDAPLSLSLPRSDVIRRLTVVIFLSPATAVLVHYQPFLLFLFFISLCYFHFSVLLFLCYVIRVANFLCLLLMFRQCFVMVGRWFPHCNWFLFQYCIVRICFLRMFDLVFKLWICLFKDCVLLTCRLQQAFFAINFYFRSGKLYVHLLLFDKYLAINKIIILLLIFNE